MAGLLDVLVRAVDAVRVLEIGTGAGTIGLQILGALPAGGLLIALERDATAAAQARGAFAAGGFGGTATVVVGDPSRYLHKIAGPFDLILQDGSAADCAALHDRVISLLKDGGLLVTRETARAGDYNEVLMQDARLVTAAIDGAGMTLSIKRQDPR